MRELAVSVRDRHFGVRLVSHRTLHGKPRPHPLRIWNHSSAAAHVSEVMMRRRPLTLGMIHRLAAGLRIPLTYSSSPTPTSKRAA
jgi:hypothetical protein